MRDSRRTGLARCLSKLGYCSRSQATELVRDGRVKLNGNVCRNPEAPVRFGKDKLQVDDNLVQGASKLYLILNKPRGVVTTASDEKGRETIFSYLDRNLPHLGPAGRLDKASEGLLLLSNDPEWAANITDPGSHLSKTYHVQVRGVPDARALQHLRAGVTDRDEKLSAHAVSLLRAGEKNAWLEIVLDQGRNRQIRRMLATLDYAVLRLIRVAIGPLALGDLAKGQWRRLSAAEITALCTF